MAGIKSTIELQDHFSGVLMNIINAVNMSVSAIEQMQDVMNRQVNASGIQGVQDQLAGATVGARELGAAMEIIHPPDLSVEMPAMPSEGAEIQNLLNETLQEAQGLRGVLQRVAADPVDASGILGIREQLTKAAVGAKELKTAMQEVPLPPDNTSISIPDMPAQWQTDTIPVFTDTGAERYQKEIAEANRLMVQLNTEQRRLASATKQMDVFPPEMTRDIQSIQARLQGVQQRIEEIGNSKIDLGTDRANAGLEHVRGQMGLVVSEQERLNDAIQNMDVQEANQAYLRMSQIVGGTEKYIRDNMGAQEQFNSEIREGTRETGNLMRAIQGAVGAYATFQSVSVVLGLSDQISSTTARLNMMNQVMDGGLRSVQELNNEIYLSAERSRGSYLATADAVAKLGLMAGNAFSGSDEVIGFMELINKQFRIAGTEAAGIDAAMLQLTQAMGSGVLRGEEYNSILEQAPNIIQNIAKYIEENGNVLEAVASRMGVSSAELAGNVQGHLKDIAGEGLLTADLLKAAMFYTADDINEKFDSMPMTFEQIWTSFQNNALMAFQPVLEQINEIANNEGFQNFVSYATVGMFALANIAQSTISLLVSGASWVSENWSWIGPIFYGVAVALAVYYGWQLMSAAATATMTGAQAALNAVMYANPVMLFVICLIALVAAFYAAVAAVNKFCGTTVSATGIIMSRFYVMKAFVYNSVLVPLQHGFAQSANFIGNVFNNPVAAVKVAFYDMCLTVVGYIKNLAAAIEALLNKIPGVSVSITAGLDNFYSGLEAAQQSVKDESGWVEYVERWEFEDYGDAARKGYERGQEIESTIGSFDPSSFLNGLMGGVNGGGSMNPIAVNANLGGLGDNIAGGTGATADNTGVMADAMEISNEELKYLRDIAEQESVNRYTLAEVTIQQTNHNNVSSKMDLDGIISGLDEAMGEAIDIMTEGVYA